jgi:hypothetical protein
MPRNFYDGSVGAQFLAPDETEDDIRTATLWFEQQIENAKQDQITAFAVGPQVRGERAWARHCALYEAQQVFLKTIGSADHAQSPETATPICCYCDAALSCACCGREQPADHAQSPRERALDSDIGILLSVLHNFEDAVYETIDDTEGVVAQIERDHKSRATGGAAQCQQDPMELALLEITHLPDDAGLHEAVLIALRALPVSKSSADSEGK